MHHDFSWVDTYFEKVRPYIYVREEDLLLIKRPNEVHKLNNTGAFILRKLLAGAKISTLLKSLNDPEKELQVYQFLKTIRDNIEGKSLSPYDNPALTTVPFDGMPSMFPVLSEIAITYRCNLNCAFCYAGCNQNNILQVSQEELSTEEIKSIIHKIFHQAKVPSISFTGGEPTLRKDLPELIACAKSFGMRVNLISNGTLIDDAKASELKDAGLDSAQISIEGVTATTHDRLVKHHGAFVKAINAIHSLKKAGIHTHSNTTLNRGNVHEATLFPEFVRNTLENDRFSMNMMIPSGSASVNSFLVLHYSEMGEIVKGIITASEKAHVKFMWYSPLPLCMFNTITHGLGNKGCAACDGLLSVDAAGNILPCSSYNETVGNLLNNNFDEIWHEEKAVYYQTKSFAYPFCKSCEHFSVCQGACPIYWQNQGYSELENTIRQQQQKTTI
ncbi:MAG: Cyclic pyranopterin monophosphate synthase 1 [Bacteroidetes bacterium ADurb.Bin408]|nr:MAG: Cyclic pyranopterin monophosphate synthase 1 [Bacteroidetes bacterium ADurb.Bin408]